MIIISELKRDNKYYKTIAISGTVRSFFFSILGPSLVWLPYHTKVFKEFFRLESG